MYIKLFLKFLNRNSWNYSCFLIIHSYCYCDLGYQNQNVLHSCVFNANCLIVTPNPSRNSTNKLCKIAAARSGRKCLLSTAKNLFLILMMIYLFIILYWFNNLYSCVPNKRAGPNKWAGWKMGQKQINLLGQINVQGGKMLNLDNRVG